jgi:LmbE family N-acetylglucosaminyl deacetylase
MQRRLLCVLAHPDDETLALGGVLARYAAEGVETHLVTATSGEQGWQGASDEHPGAPELARIREAELRAAAAVLGIQGLTLLRYPDGELAAADPAEAIARIAEAVRRIRPQVVVTFGPDGATGHPDHIAISQLTAAALLGAADPAYRTGGGGEAHRVAKLYYLAPTRASLDQYDKVFGDSAMTIDGVRRSVAGWPEWSISAGIATRPFTRQVWRAICAHRSQFPLLDATTAPPPGIRATLGETTTFYRVYGLVDGGHQHEIDLFAGLDGPWQHGGGPAIGRDAKDARQWEEIMC